MAPSIYTAKRNPSVRNWVDRFMERHKNIQIKLPKELEAARVHSITKEGLRVNDLDDLIKQLSAGTTRMYNVQETGVQKGEIMSDRVVGIA